MREEDGGDPGGPTAVETPRWGVVSVVIPVHNGEEYLREGIESVLAQTHDRVQVIVVDDGSSDESARVVQSFGSLVRYCYQPQRGAAAARNRGVELADGGWIAFLDADDLWEPDKLRKQLLAFADDAAADMVFGHVPGVLQSGIAGRDSADDPHSQHGGSGLPRRNPLDEDRRLSPRRGVPPPSEDG